MPTDDLQLQQMMERALPCRLCNIGQPHYGSDCPRQKHGPAVLAALREATDEKDRQIAELVGALERANDDLRKCIPSDADDWPMPSTLVDLANERRRLVNQNELLIARHKEQQR